MATSPRDTQAPQEVPVSDLRVVEICAGAGGQSLGLELAGFEHELAVELDANACNTLRANRDSWKVAEGDVASDVWEPNNYHGIDLLAGGVPCPPFTIAGKQLGATDERDLFAWAIELCGTMQPRALLLENVRGLSLNRFAAYRQHVLDRLRELHYVAEWRLLHASAYGVPQLRPRFVLVAMREKDGHFAHFAWPEPHDPPQTVGETLHDLMAADGWPGADAWREKANSIAPTIVGGSKKHGGADLGPTRAKRAWAELAVDALGVADAPPTTRHAADFVPKLTTEMVARIQGWDDERYRWVFTGKKTSRYRQVGNAFPPPVAEAVGTAIRAALERTTPPRALVENLEAVHDPIYSVLRGRDRFMSLPQIAKALGEPLDTPTLERHINHLSRDFNIEIKERPSGPAYRLGEFKAFIGQNDHARHKAFQLSLGKIS
jgi:DNA (cytosine-5)-methyltransferase 1